MQGCALSYLSNGVTATVAGFGAHDVCGTQADPFLRQANLIVEDYRCASCPDFIRRDFYLTASAVRSSACFGDSGGPFIQNTPAGEFVIGIVNGGPGKDGVACTSTNVFARPNAFVDWIQTESGRTLEQPTCAMQLALPSGLHSDKTPVAAANASGDDYIVGGFHVPPGKYPQVSLVAYQGGWCTGVLVAPDVVLTAGHCIFEQELPKVIVGAYKVNGTEGETIEVTRAIHHPQLDIGVLVLARAAATTPANVADKCVEDELVAGAAVTMVGFGVTDRCGFSYGFDGMLREGELTIADPECNAADSSCEWPGAEIMASSPTVNGCFGDSGGPLFVASGDKLFVAGITSRGASEDPTVALCDGGGIYPRVDAINQWIERETGRTLTGACDLDDEVATATCSSTGGRAAALPFAMLVFGFVVRRRQSLKPARGRR